MVFVFITGQRDNLGDSILRRPLVRAAQAEGPCDVYVGLDAEDWSNLALRPEDRLYTSRGRWLMALLRRASSTRVWLVLNAGEMLPDRRFIFQRLMLLPALALVKAGGGGLVQAGFGLRDPFRSLPRIARIFGRASAILSWRDEASRFAAGIGTVSADWAFAEGASQGQIVDRYNREGSERTLAISLRGDRDAPSADWLKKVRKSASDLNARVVVVCQVRRDAARAEWLSQQLGSDLVAWDDSVDHARHERRVRSVYRQATWIASDRLHAIIVAVTEGSVPLDLVPDRSRKISRTLSVVDLALFPADGAAHRLLNDRDELLVGLSAARLSTTKLAGHISDVIRGAKTGRVRVLHSLKVPDGTTRYSRHMASTSGFHVQPMFFNWFRAFTSHFDVFHIHWPEHFIPDRKGMRGSLQRTLARIFIFRLKRKQIPVVRTLHNIVPHEGISSGAGENSRSALDGLTALEIHLVDGDPKVTPGNMLLIPHGSYREPYAVTPPERQICGRVLYFGRIEEYKGIPELLAALPQSHVGSLRIVGHASNREVSAQVTAAATMDARVTYRFGFVPDAELALEIRRSALCIFPYRELHSSGAVLVALSLDRPVLVPLTPTTLALQQEVGEAWVRIYEKLDGAELDLALEWAKHNGSVSSRPNLRDRTWHLVRDRHAVGYMSLV